VVLLSPGQRGQAEVVAQRGAGVVGAEDAALLEQRDHLVRERRQAVGGEVRDQDVAVGWPSAARARYSLASATGFLANWRTLARPLAMSVSLTTGSKSGSGPSTSKSGSSVFHSCSMKRSAVAGET
jgi:hypothetical protein